MTQQIIEAIKQRLRVNPDLEVVYAKDRIFVPYSDGDLTFPVKNAAAELKRAGIQATYVMDLPESARYAKIRMNSTSTANNKGYASKVELGRRVKVELQSLQKHSPIDAELNAFTIQHIENVYKKASMSRAPLTTTESMKRVIRKLNNEKELKASWDAYAAKREIPLENPINKNYLKKTQQVLETVVSNPDIASKLFAKTGPRALQDNTFRTTATGVTELSNKGIDADLDIRQRVLKVDNKAFVFSDRYLPDSSFAKTSLLLKNHFNSPEGLRGINQIIAVTPKGVKKAFVKNTGSTVTVDGKQIQVNYASLNAETVNAAKSDILAYTKAGSFAEADAMYQSKQALLEAQALDQLKTVVKAASTGNSLDSLLNLKYDDMVEYSMGLKDSKLKYGALQKYTNYKGVKLGDILTNEDKQSINDNIYKQKQVEKAKNLEVIQNRYTETIKTAEALGVGLKQVPIKDKSGKVIGTKPELSTKEVYDSDLSNLDNKGQLKAVAQMEDTIRATKELRTRRSFPKKDVLERLASTDPDAMARLLVKNQDNPVFFKHFGLLEHSTDNPILNIEGKIKQPIAKSLMKTILKDAYKGNIKTVGSELVKLGKDFLSDKSKKAIRAGVTRNNFSKGLSINLDKKVPSDILRTLTGKRDHLGRLPEDNAIGFDKDGSLILPDKMSAFFEVPNTYIGTERPNADDVSGKINSRYEELLAAEDLRIAKAEADGKSNVNRTSNRDLQRQAANEINLITEYSDSATAVSNLIDRFEKGPTPNDISEARGILSRLDPEGTGHLKPGELGRKLKKEYEIMLANEVAFEKNPSAVRVRLSPYIVDALSNNVVKDFDKLQQGSKSTKYNMGLVDFVDENHADYSKLMEAYRGEASSTHRLVFGKDTNLVRNKILTTLHPSNNPRTNPELYAKLENYYSGTNVLTNFDLAALGTIDTHTLGFDEFGKKATVLSPRVNPNDIIEGILKDHTPKNILKVRPQFNQTKPSQLKEIKSASSYNKNAASRFLVDNDLIKAMQSRYAGTPTAGRILSAGENISKHLSTVLQNKAYIDYESGTINKGVYEAMIARHSEPIKLVNQAVEAVIANIQDHMTNGRFASAEAQLGALESLAKDLELGAKVKKDGTMTKKSVELLKTISNNGPEELLASRSKSNLRNQNLKHAVAQGFNPYESGDLITLAEAATDRIVNSNTIKALLDPNKAKLAKTTKVAAQGTEARDEILKSMRFKGIEQQDYENKKFTGDTRVTYKKPKANLKDRVFDTEEELTAYLLENNDFIKSIVAKVPKEARAKINWTSFLKGMKGRGVNLKATYDTILSKAPKTTKISGKTSVSKAGENLKSQASKVQPKKNVLSQEELDMFSALGLDFTKLNSGGKIPGKGTKDEVPALLTKGEVVVDRETASNLGIETQSDYHRFKEAARRGMLKKYATGGPVGLDNDFADLMKDLLKTDPTRAKAITTTVNAMLKDPTLSGPISMASAEQYSKNILNQSVPPRRGSGSRKNANISIDAENLTVHMNDKSFTSFVDSKGNKLNFNEASSLLDRGGLDLRTTAKYQGILEAQNLGFSTAEYKDILSNKIDATLSSKIKDLDVLAVEDLKASDNALKAFKKNIVDHRKAPKTYKDKRSEGLERSFNKLSDNQDLFKQITGIDVSSIHSIKGVDIADTVNKKLDAFGKAIQDYKFDPKKIPSGEGVGRLRQYEQALGNAGHILTAQEFDTGFSTQKAGLAELGSGVGRSINLKEGAAARARDFANLTKQNLLFAASYMGINAVQTSLAGTIGFFGEFDDALGNLQAITGETTEGLNVMKDAVKQVSTETKFSALEITDAATILGQAGFGSSDIKKSLKGVVNLATATGSKLADSTQVLTSALTIWDNAITDSGKFANQFTAAINESKLDINSLALTLQYAGNIAASADVSVTDLVTSTSLLKDAGIKRGSTLGTGQRLLIADFANPTKKFAKSLDDVGISLAKFKKVFQTKGLEGTVKLLRDTGYGLASASKGMEVREKAIFLALSNQVDKFSAFKDAITDTNAANVANATQMNAVGNKFKNMINSWQISINDTLSMGSEGSRSILDALTVNIKEKSAKESKLRKDRNVAKGDLTNTGVSGLQTALTSLGIIGASYPAINDAAKTIIAQRQMSGATFPRGSALGKIAAKLDMFKTLEPMGYKLATGAVKNAPLVAASAAVGALTSEDNNKISGAISGIASAGMFIVAGKGVEKLAKISEAAGKGKIGFAKKAGIYGSVLAADLLISDAANNPKSLSDKLTTIIGRGIEGAIAGAALTSETGPGAALGAGVGGAIGLGVGTYQAFSGEQPDKGTFQALTVGVNELKATNTELDATFKAGLEINDPGNFDYKIAKDDSARQVSIKKSRAISFLDQLDKSTEGLNAVVQSYTGQDLNGAIANKVGTYTVKELKGTNFNIAEFSVKDSTIEVGTRKFKGSFTDAIQTMLFNKAEAMSTVITEEVGSKIFNDIKNSSPTNLSAKLGDTSSLSDVKTVVSQQAIGPINELFKAAPALAVKNFDATSKLLDEALAKGRAQVLDNKSSFFASSSYNKIMAAKDLADYDKYANRQKAGLESNFINVGFNARSPKESVDTAREQLKKLRAEKPGVPDSELLKLPALVNTRSSNLSLVKKFGGINKLVDIANQGRVLLDDAQSKTLKAMRSMANTVGDNLSKTVLTIGSELSNIGLDAGKGLVSTRAGLSSLIKAQSNSYGVDITKLSDKTLTKGAGRSIAGNLDRDVRNFFDKTNVPDTKSTTLGSVTVKNLDLTGAKIAGFDKATIKAYKSIQTGVAAFMAKANRYTKTSQATDFSTFKHLVNKEAVALKLGYKDLAAAVSDTTKALGVAGSTLVNYKSFKGSSLKDIMSVFNQEKKDLVNKALDRGKDKIKLSRKYRETDIKTSYDRSVDKINVNTKNAFRDLNIKIARGYQDLAISSARKMQEIQTSYYRGLDKIQLDYNRGIAKINTSLRRGREDIATSEARGRRDINTSRIRNLENIALSNVRGRQDITTSGVRGRESIGLSYNRGVQSINLSQQRGLEDIALAFDRNTAKLELNATRGREDLNTRNDQGIQDAGIRYANKLEDIAKNFSYRMADIQKNYLRQIASLGRSYNENINTLGRHYQNTLDAIARGRQDAIDAFNRALERPQVVTIDPAALSTIANNLNDVGLAFDAHKAALEANTSVVKQQLEILKSQEDVTKAAYKDAYKKVGGDVYNSDGSVNKDFTDAYNRYIDNNSGSVIDAMLEQALNTSMAGAGFDIQQALTSPEYMAGQVSNPTAPITTAGAVVGSGLSDNELASSLAGIQAGQVRVTTTAGVILDAQGGMGGALFDLDTTMIQFDIKVREAGFQFRQAIADAGYALSFQLNEASIKKTEADADAELRASREREAASTDFSRNLEALALNFARGLEALTLSFERAGEDLALSNQQAIEDLTTKIARAFEDLDIRIAQAGENLQIQLTQAGEDLSTRVARATEDLAIRIGQAITDLQTRTHDATADLELGIQRAGIDLATQTANATQDLRNKIYYAGQDLETSIRNSVEDLNLARSRGGEDINTSNYDAMVALKTQFDESLANSILAYDRSIAALNTAVKEMAIDMRTQMSQGLNAWLTAVTTAASTGAFQLAIDVTSIEAQLNNALSGLQLNNDLVVNQVSAMYQAALSSEAMTRVLNTLGRDIGGKFIKIFTESSKTVSTQMTQVDSALKAGFEQAVTTGKDIVKDLKAVAISTRELVNETNTYDPSTLVPKIEQTKTNMVKLKELSPVVSDTATTLGTATDELKTATTDTITALRQIPQLGEAITAAVQGTGNAVNTAVNSLSSISIVGNALIGLAYSVSVQAQQAAAAIRNAVSQATAAVPTAVPTHSSVGGPVGTGYGGGDTLPFMLEPGEYVVRKEIVREKGQAWFDSLNAGATQEVVRGAAIGLPSSSGSNINVNIGVSADVGVGAIEAHIDQIADGVKRVFEEYQ